MKFVADQCRHCETYSWAYTRERVCPICNYGTSVNRRPKISIGHIVALFAVTMLALVAFAHITTGGG